MIVLFIILGLMVMVVAGPPGLLLYIIGLIIYGIVKWNLQQTDNSKKLFPFKNPPKTVTAEDYGLEYHPEYKLLGIFPFNLQEIVREEVSIRNSIIATSVWTKIENPTWVEQAANGAIGKRPWTNVTIKYDPERKLYYRDAYIGNKLIKDSLNYPGSSTMRIYSYIYDPSTDASVEDTEEIKLFNRISLAENFLENEKYWINNNDNCYTKPFYKTVRANYKQLAEQMKEYIEKCKSEYANSQKENN